MNVGDFAHLPASALNLGYNTFVNCQSLSAQRFNGSIVARHCRSVARGLRGSESSVYPSQVLRARRGQTSGSLGATGDLAKRKLTLNLNEKESENN